MPNFSEIKEFAVENKFAIVVTAAAVFAILLII